MGLACRIGAFALLSLAAFQSAPASAVITNPTPQRSYVSLSGQDTNNCGPAFPCRTWQAALAQTQPGGEILTLDSGGFGTLVINQSVTLVVPSGVYGGMSPPASTSGIVINAPGASVVIRGVSIKGQSLTGTIGIDVQQAAQVVIENSTVTAVGAGIRVATGGKLTLENIGVRFCSLGMVLAPPPISPLAVTMANSAFSYSTGDGVSVNDNSVLDVTSSLFSFNGGYGINAWGTVTTGSDQVGVVVELSNSRLVMNGSGGLQINDSSGNTNLTSNVAASLTRDEIIGGTNCVNVEGAATAVFLGNNIDGCTTGINVAATASGKTMGTGSNEVGGTNKTDIGGTLNGALTQKAYF